MKFGPSRHSLLNNSAIPYPTYFHVFATDENSKSRVWRTASVFRSIDKMCETTCLKERDGLKPIVRRFARLFYSARRHISTPYYLDERKHHRFIQLMGTWVELQLKLLTNPTKKVDSPLANHLIAEKIFCYDFPQTGPVWALTDRLICFCTGFVSVYR